MPPKKAEGASTASKSKSHHATYQDMITDAIVELKDRNGSSRQKLKQYVKANNNITVTQNMFDSLFNKALKNGVEKGVFQQPKGPSGGTKLAKKTPAPKEKKPAATAAKKAAPKKDAAAKPAAKKAAAPKAAAKPAAKKPAAKKAAAPKKTAAAKPAAADKVKTGRVTKKAAAPKPAAKKAAPKKAAPKKADAKAKA